MQWPLPQFPTRMASGAMQSLSRGDSPHTEGSWVTLASGLDWPGSWVVLKQGPYFSSGSYQPLFADLAIGGSGSETLVVANVLVGCRPAGSTLLPLHVPAGATVRGRVSGLQSQAISLGLDVYGGEPDSGVTTPGRVTTYGVNEGSSAGVALTPSGTASTKGSWVEVASSTSYPIHGVMVLAQPSAFPFVNATYTVDIAVGSSSSETVILGDLMFTESTGGWVAPHSPGYLPLALNIPAGVRLSARCAASTTTTNTLQVVVYGFTN